MTNNFSEPTPEQDAAPLNQTPSSQHPSDASAASEPSELSEPQVVIHTDQHTVQIRRAPKFSVLIATGAVLGLIVAVILAVAFETPEGETTWQQVFGYLFLPSAAIGSALFGVIALGLDRWSRNHTSTVTAEQIKVKPADSATDSATDSAAEPTEESDR